MFNFKEELNKTIQSVKQGLNDLSKQINYETEEAVKEYKEQKEKLREWAKNKQPYFDNLKSGAAEEVKDLKVKFERFKERLNKEVNSEAEIKEDQEALSASMDEIQDEAEKLENATDENTKDFAANLSSQLGVLQSKARRISAALRAEAKEEWKEFQEEHKESIDKLKIKANELGEDAKENWQDLKEEVGSLFKKIRSKFKKKKEFHDPRIV